MLLRQRTVTASRSIRRPQINDEAKDVEGEDQTNDPLENSPDIIALPIKHVAEDDRQRDLNDDEDEFDPEGEPEDAVFAVFDTQTLVFPAGEDGAEDVAEHEEEEEETVEGGVATGVEDAQADETDGAEDGAEDGEDGEDLLKHRFVAGEPAFVAEPAFGEEGEVEEDGCEDAAYDEEGFEVRGADVGDVAIG